MALRPAMPFQRSSVALCIIADEVLNGKTVDTNSRHVARKAFTAGFDLQEIRVIKDEETVIMRTVREMSAFYDIVFTSGGIGPTHDDLTYESIAKAFNRPLIFHQPTADRMKLKSGLDSLNDGQVRMCTIPKPSEEVLNTEGLWQPIVCVENVYMLPGVPGLFTRMFDNWLAKKANKYSTCPMLRVSIKTDIKESTISKSLGDYHKQIADLGWSIGSYPKLNVESGDSWVEISLVGPKLEGVQKSKLDALVMEMKKTYNATDMQVE